MLQNIEIDSSDDEIPQPMKLSALTTALLAQGNDVDSPEKRKPKLKISRNTSPGSNTPGQDSVTPAPSLRIKRVPLRGAPMRRLRRTPQSEEENAPSQDQENQPISVKMQPENVPDSVLKATGSVMKVAEDRKHVPQEYQSPIQRSSQQQEKHMPLQALSANTPRRPAPPPPPKMSVLETATAAAGAATTKTRERKKRSTLSVNGKHYSQMDRIGRGGSSAVYRVMAENFKLLALKRVKLEDADEAAVRGFKGEIDLLQKLKNVDRVVRLYDWEVDEQRQVLSVVCLHSIEKKKLKLTSYSSWNLVNLTWPA